LVQHDILWPDLIDAWGLNPDEVRRVNRQQGECCAQCGANLRSRTLAGGLLECLDGPPSMDLLAGGGWAADLRLLEINEAGSLSPILGKFKQHTLVRYPAFDMQQLALPTGAFDAVIHSDTLEHVPDPVAGLRECHRVLSPQGFLLCTVPVVPTRLTRRREGLPPAYHGNAGETPADQRVVTEYGADFFLDFMAAGWTKLSLFTLGTPDAIAIIGTK
jgi:SAM-dependent methyltransferase